MLPIKGYLPEVTLPGVTYHRIRKLFLSKQYLLYIVDIYVNYASTKRYTYNTDNTDIRRLIFIYVNIYLLDSVFHDYISSADGRRLFYAKRHDSTRSKIGSETLS